MNPATFLAFSPFHPDDKTSTSGRRGWLSSRRTVVFSAHTFPRPGNPVSVNNVTRTITAVTVIPDSDIAVCSVDRPFPSGVCKPLKVARTLPRSVTVMHWWRDPQTFKVDAKWGYNTMTGMLWPMPEQEKIEGKPGDSGVPWIAKYAWRWKVVGHTKAANSEALYGPAYPHFRKELVKAIRTTGR